MADIVNDYFKRFYPKTIDREKMCFEYIQPYGGWRYEDSSVSKIFPEIVCADGFKMSVQGHFGAYSHPRDDFADEYREVEILAVPKADELFAPYERDCNLIGDGEMIYPNVPVEIVVRVIEKHGGLKP